MLEFSFVVPVYNRPDEVAELLASLSRQDYTKPFEVVIVEDGSSQPAESIVRSFEDRLKIKYWYKPNSGPGDSRNYGMQRASGNYFILVDSDCILPPEYLSEVAIGLTADYVDCFGGPDSAHPSFNPLQKAISFCMTSVLTTGGIRGSEKAAEHFQPRSFNMGLSKKAFQKSGGFGSIHPGEDPDLSLRLLKLGFRLKYLPGAVVFHKRRINFRSFYKQVHKFGLTRPILNQWHPGSARITYWFPTIFYLGLFASLLLPLILSTPWSWLPLGCYILYLLAVIIAAASATASLHIGLLAGTALLVQFAGYGLGFLKSSLLLTFSKKKPAELFPNLFFNS
ncbi:glycosyltransferase [Robiginitalea sp. IMCC44478]|uniref:glycosyltransferase n=1 Tax=Robiginitalea sp. IMCC44478 TaxID=3459122 RepID=UPI004042452F